MVLETSALLYFDSTKRFDSAIKDYLPMPMTAKMIGNILKSLKDKGLVISSAYQTEVVPSLKMHLIAKALQTPEGQKTAKDIATSHVPAYSYDAEWQNTFRKLLLYPDSPAKKFTSWEYNRITSNAHQLYPTLIAMMDMPEWDSFWKIDPLLTTPLIHHIIWTNHQLLDNYAILEQFFQRNPLPSQISHYANTWLAHNALMKGRFEQAHQLSLNLNNTQALICKSLLNLSKGDYPMAVSLFDLARTSDMNEDKITKQDFEYFHEYFYWFTFALWQRDNFIKKADTFNRKLRKSSFVPGRVTIPLLHFIKNEFEEAESYHNNYKAMNKFSVQMQAHAFYQLLNEYLISGKLNNNDLSKGISLAQNLQLDGFLFYLNELLYILTQSGAKLPPQLKNAIPKDFPTPLFSRLIKQEKWEQALDGLLMLSGTSTSKAKSKDESSSRICYHINLNNKYIQPILQTRTARGWTSGRNIALKRFKEREVDGLTEQDIRVAKAITSYSRGYYGNNDWYIDFAQAITELCGHPYLFLSNQPDIALELIKGQPELITEKTKNGICLKTNIRDDDNDDVIIIKETQTRYKVIPLNEAQRKVIRMLNNGLTIPESGRDKLMKTVAGLSHLMNVQSDLVEENSQLPVVEADARIRIQILPIGDGLKAEMFVKPFNTVPPYAKPGKGGKVMYGTLDGEKTQAVRPLKTETEYAQRITNDLSQTIDADLENDAVMFEDPYQCLELLETIGRHHDIAVVEWPEGERFRLKRSASFKDLSLRAKGKGQWFDIEGELTIDPKTVISLKELLTRSAKSKGRFIELSDGEFLAISQELKKQLDDLQAIATTDKNGVKINSFAIHALDEITQKAASFKGDKGWKDLQKRIAEADKLNIDVPATLDAELRPYQEEGFRWMVRLNAWGSGACLADDMGLGKTLQAIAMMLHKAEAGPSMVVCPASVVPNWCNELQKFAPTLNPIVLRSSHREEVFTNLAPFDVLVITYGLLQTEEQRMSAVNWAVAVLDEAHAIKNTQTKSSKAAMSIQADFRLALTGTPLQNHLGELWNLFNFCNPGLLGSHQAFTDRYVKNDNPAQKAHLKKIISPFILRRTKNKVLDELPAKTEITHTVELSEAEMAFYEALRQQAIENLENGEGNNGQQHLQALAEITKLRLACCNTSLVRNDIQLPSSKLEAFFDIINELRENKHRALVFSQFVGHLSIVRQALDKEGIAYQYLDGSTPIADRQTAVKAFQSGKGDVFLISLKAGGLGLNLTAADYVLHLDPWWNPAIEDQASDRAHRMGQTRPVTIYRLVAKNTIEEKIVKLHATKRDMADSLLDGTDQSAKLSTADLLDLLKGN